MNKKYSFRIQPQDVDFQLNLTLASLTNILLTTAGYNADENGFGIRKLNEQNCSWVLLGLAIEMKDFPTQYESIVIETWVEKVGRAATTRNFRIFNNKNEEVGLAVSIWAMIDIKTRRAQDLESLEGIHAHATNEPISISKPIKLNSISLDPVNSFKVKYSHIDINGHTSSMRYVEWISDCLDLDIYKKSKINRFEINFINEILFDENVDILMEKFENKDFHFEIRSNNKTSCKARIVLNDNI